MLLTLPQILNNCVCIRSTRIRKIGGVSIEICLRSSHIETIAHTHVFMCEKSHGKFCGTNFLDILLILDEVWMDAK